MLDPQLLRNDLEGVANSLAPRGYALDVQEFAELENRRNSLQTLRAIPTQLAIPMATLESALMQIFPVNLWPRSCAIDLIPNAVLATLTIP